MDGHTSNFKDKTFAANVQICLERFGTIGYKQIVTMKGLKLLEESQWHTGPKWEIL